MKVCFLVGTLARGGAEKQLIYMLRALKNAGISSRILSLTKGEAHEAEIREMGLPIQWIGNNESRIIRLMKIIGNLRKTPADIVQSSHFYTNIYTGGAGKVLNIPSIGAIRNDLNSEIKSHNFLGKWQISLPHFLIANSNLAYRRAIERGILPQKIEFVRNVVEVDSPHLYDSPKQNRLVKLLFVGRLEKQKRPERFVRLASILTGRFPHLPIEFQIAGNGELKSKLENLAGEFDLLPDKLKFLGVCPDMNKIYRQADVLVSTSEHEGTPNVVLEAMAHGLPVIATRVGGTPEILSDERGFLIADGDENELIEAASALILNRELRRKLGFAGKKFVEQNHSLDSLQKQLTGIYEKLVAAY